MQTHTSTTTRPSIHNATSVANTAPMHRLNHIKPTPQLPNEDPDHMAMSDDEMDARDPEVADNSDEDERQSEDSNEPSHTVADNVDVDDDDDVNLPIRNKKFPEEFDHIVDPAGILETRKDTFHVIGSFGHVASIESKTVVENSKHMPIVASKSFTRDKKYKPTSKDWFADVQKTNIVGLKVQGAVRGKKEVDTAEGARKKTTIIEMSNTVKTIPMLRVVDEHDPSIDTLLTPLPAAFVQTLWAFGKTSVVNPKSSEKKIESWKTMLKILFYDVYGTSDHDELDAIMADENNIWVYDTNKGAFERYLLENQWHRYRLPKSTKTPEEKAAAKAERDARGGGGRRVRRVTKPKDDELVSNAQVAASSQEPPYPSNGVAGKRRWIEINGTEFTDEHGNTYRTTLQRLLA
jgi:hypothetical protein